MKNTKSILRFTISLLCAVLIFNSLTLNAAGLKIELRHAAFLRGGNAISTALTNENASVVSKAIEGAIPSAPPIPAPVPTPAKPPATGKSGGMSKPMWALLIGGFAVSGVIIYKVATGPGASIRNCSTCSK